MGRISMCGVVVIEPAKSILTWLGIKIGFSEEVEDAGNFVYRFTPKELNSAFKSQGFVNSWWKKYIMYYPHQPNFWFKIFDSKVLRPFYIFFFKFINKLCSGFGNKISFVAWRKVPD